MARKKSVLGFSGSLEVEATAPLDARTVVPLKADLTVASSFPYAYEGLTVYVTEEKKSYTLIGSDTTVLANWKEVGSGSGSITVDDALSETSLNPIQNRVLHGIFESQRQAMQYMQDEIDANETAIADRYTKAETDGKIAEAMTDVDNEHFHPVTTLPDPQDADETKRPKENHEYVLIEYEQDGVTIKTETHYLFYGGVYHQKPTGGISLEGYATEQYVDDGLDGKQDAITGGTTGNVLVKASDTDGDFVWRQLGKDNMIYDVLWENPTPNTWVNPVLSRSAREYDMVLFEARQQDGKWCQSFLNVADLGIGEEKELLINGYSWITIKFTDDTHIVGVNGTSSATVVAQKITGIVFSRLDGTIGRWEKIGEWLEGGVPKEYTVDLDGYNAFSFEVLRRNDYGWYNTALVLAEDFVVGEKVAIYGSDDVEVWIERIDATTIRRNYQNGGTAVGLRMYGYRETAISDADVQRIAAQVPGGSSITVDQTYDATSENAQSGKAVAEALATVDGSTNFDVTSIPQGPTGANEINAVISNKDTENARVSYVRQSDGTLPNTVNLGVKSGLGEDSFELPTKEYADEKASFTTDSDWWYKINPDNTFEAYYYKNGVSLTIQENSGNFYRSALQTLNLPTGITSVYDATPLHASVNTSHNNYPCFGTLASVATNLVKYYALSGSSRGQSPNYIVTAHVFGTLAAKA